MIKKCIICGHSVSNNIYAQLNGHRVHMGCWLDIIPKPQVNETLEQTADRIKTVYRIGEAVVKAYEGTHNYINDLSGRFEKWLDDIGEPLFKVQINGKWRISLPAGAEEVFTDQELDILRDEYNKKLEAKESGKSQDMPGVRPRVHRTPGTEQKDQ